MKWSRKHSIVAGAALIAATNAVALLGVTYNRNGEPESTLQLTQRELAPMGSWRNHENSGLTLRLQWRVLDEDITNPTDYRWRGSRWSASPKWLDRDKMAALGFDVAVPDRLDDHSRTFQRQLARDVLLVLEMEGPTYQRALAEATEAAAKVKAMGKKDSDEISSEILEHEGKTNSRLFVVDAGLDAASLRSRYPDRSRYAIVSGRVEPAGPHNPRAAYAHKGHVSAINVDEINVPLELRSAFDGAVGPNVYSPKSTQNVAYDATVTFGRRLEPWLATAAKPAPLAK
jgi:Domain of unknown function (DUF4824)